MKWFIWNWEIVQLLSNDSFDTGPSEKGQIGYREEMLRVTMTSFQHFTIQSNSFLLSHNYFSRINWVNKFINAYGQARGIKHTLEKYISEKNDYNIHKIRTTLYHNHVMIWKGPDWKVGPVDSTPLAWGVKWKVKVDREHSVYHKLLKGMDMFFLPLAFELDLYEVPFWPLFFLVFRFWPLGLLASMFGLFSCLYFGLFID